MRSYKPGELITVGVEVTANHLGYFEFRLCNVDNMNGDATQDCLDKTILKDAYGNTQIQIGSYTGHMTLQLQLPKGFTCQHCVFQVS